MFVTLHSAHPLRAEHAAQAAQADTDHAIAWARSAAHRSAPYWPFAPLTPHQQAQRQAQERALRAGQVL